VAFRACVCEVVEREPFAAAFTFSGNAMVAFVFVSAEVVVAVFDDHHEVLITLIILGRPDAVVVVPVLPHLSAVFCIFFDEVSDVIDFDWDVEGVPGAVRLRRFRRDRRLNVFLRDVV